MTVGESGKSGQFGCLYWLRMIRGDYRNGSTKYLIIDREREAQYVIRLALKQKELIGRPDQLQTEKIVAKALDGQRYPCPA